MRVLIVGGGAREHALAWRWLRDAPDDEIIVGPGNGGTAAIARNVAVDVTDAHAVARLAAERAVDLVVIGPDAAAAAGVADACAADSIAVFGPSAAAARIESSKTFAKTLMDRAGVPTPRWIAGGAERRDTLRAFAEDVEGRCVVKADGLALGKGVTVCGTVADAMRAIGECFDERRFGDAGRRVVVEQRIEGCELSVLGISDGATVRALVPARDHKRALDGDRGPNTGGMGAVAPPPDADRAVTETALRTVLQPCVDAMRDSGTPFVGCLYAGLMLTGDGLQVLEFNARFGDPEAQVVLPLLDESLPSLLLAATRGALAGGIAPVRAGCCVGVVAAARGYPGAVASGQRITGLESLDPDALCFHAGTRRDEDGILRTSGGRVLTMAAVAASPAAAREAAYANLQRVHFDGMWFRSDIGEAGVRSTTESPLQTTVSRS